MAAASKKLSRRVAEEGYEAYRRRVLEIKLGRLEEDDKQQYGPAKNGLLYNSDDEDPEVIHGL